MTHNCDQSAELRKHTSSQLPKKASGSFKPRRPTPKRQASSKTNNNSTSTATSLNASDKEKDKENVKAEETQNMVSYFYNYFLFPNSFLIYVVFLFSECPRDFKA